MINTYNETDLHKTLKEKYCTEYAGIPEVKIGNYICDILTKDHKIIEIQTTSLYKLVPKLKELSKDFEIKVVFPYPLKKLIEHYSEDGELLKTTKSPAKKTWVSVFSDLIGIVELVAEKKITLDILGVALTEMRVDTVEPVQTKNKSRRFKQRWYKVGKRLDSIIETKTFTCIEDFKDLLPFEKGRLFTSKDLLNYVRKKYLYRVLAVLKRSGIIKTATKQGNVYVYFVE